METLKFFVLVASAVFIFFLVQDTVISIYQSIKEHFDAKNKGR